MEAVVLVGGLGTRLGYLTKLTPKPMLPIRNKPFLELLLKSVKKKGIDRVVLAVGYQKEVVQSYFDTNDRDLPQIVFSVEDKPLGTGGAICQALMQTESDSVFVLNGDSYLDLSFQDMKDQHEKANCDITIASCFVRPADRYGVMQVNDERQVISFEEKGKKPEGLINGGVYLLNKVIMRRVLDKIVEIPYSFEEDVLANRTLELIKCHFQVDGYFLDIGVPFDYEKAQKELYI
ncbi:nucleotidyltransferase family protein [Hydrogenovibrio thermophilus]|uniref:D-glycero-D-manno-heptose 1-phosphate guanosyltransferase n=1 Tax=Hydrogenovibrio thermophilus TaxID=265883 RepID=A0A410H4D2_9GAMM|nr:nucleotidyltransferase family protein [Hydrogenovibrio thermophilus]QAB15779.1 D-glycero-D-manno-heptose 1-phosphate guanosyltransferase [Hydrogenovibrio thermophilus]